jgi:cobalt/nickel transport system permease protein
MHLPDGLIAPGLSLTGYVGSFALIILTTRRKMLVRVMSQVSLVASVVFVSSLLHIPMGFTTVHFTFIGLAGIMLGPLAFPAVALAIAMQSILMGHGGFTTIGINSLNMGTAALLTYLLFSRLRPLLPKGRKNDVAMASLAGFLGSLFKVSAGSAVLIMSGFPRETFYLIAMAHIPVILGESFAAGLAAAYLLKFAVWQPKQGGEVYYGKFVEVRQGLRT